MRGSEAARARVTSGEEGREGTARQRDASTPQLFKEYQRGCANS